MTPSYTCVYSISDKSYVLVKKSIYNIGVERRFGMSNGHADLARQTIPVGFTSYTRCASMITKFARSTDYKSTGKGTR